MRRELEFKDLRFQLKITNHQLQLPITLNYRPQYDIKHSLTDNFVDCLLKIGTINSVQSEHMVGW